MKTKAVHDYLKKKRGLCAAEGGEVPDEKKKSGEFDDLFKREDSPEFRFSPTRRVEIPQFNAADGGEVPDEEEEDEEEEAPEEVMDTLAPPPPPAATPEEQKQEAIKAFLKQKYDVAADDSGVKAAQAEQKHQNFVANLGEGIHEMVTAKGVANGMAPDSGSFFRGIRDQGKQGVDQAQAARQSKIDGFLKQTELNRQVAQDQMAKGTYENQQKAAKFIQDRQDPNSPYSKSLQEHFKSVWGDQLGGVDVSTLSAAQMEELGKQLEGKAERDYKQADLDLRKRTAGAKTADTGSWHEGKEPDAEGNVWAMNDKTGERKIIGKAGVRPKDATDVQIGAGGFAKRAMAADEITNSLLTDGYNPTSKQAALRNNPLTGSVTSNESDRKFGQAKRDFISAVLRKESGAAISKEEFANEDQKYFPQIGDSADVIAQKAASRQRAIATLKAQAGPGYDKVADVAQPAPGQKKDGATAYADGGEKTAPNASFHPEAGAAEKWANANLNSPDPKTAEKARAILERLGDDKPDVPSSGSRRP